MLAARLTSVCRGSAGVLLRPTLAAAAPRPPLAQLARGYREPGRPFARRSRLREAQAQMAETAAQTTKGKVGGELYLLFMFLPETEQLKGATNKVGGKSHVECHI